MFKETLISPSPSPHALPPYPGTLMSGRAQVNNFTWFIACSSMDGFSNSKQREQLLQNQLNHMKAKKIPRLWQILSIRKLSLHDKFQMLNSAFCNVKHLAIWKKKVLVMLGKPSICNTHGHHALCHSFFILCDPSSLKFPDWTVHSYCPIL